MFLRGLKRKVMLDVIKAAKERDVVLGPTGMVVGGYTVNTESNFLVKIYKNVFFVKLNVIQSIIMRRFVHKLHANKILKNEPNTQK